MITVLTPTQEQILLCAERLFAEKGIGRVSTRELAREAGQKNHSALHYHFGSIDALIEAILDYRMTPLNRTREAMLNKHLARGQAHDIRGLVEVIVRPFADELLRPRDESRYLNLIWQLMSLGEWQTLFTGHPLRASAVLQAGDLLIQAMKQQLPEDIAIERARLLGLHVLNTVAEWDALARRDDLELNKKALDWRVDNFIIYLVGGLTSPHDSH